MKLFKLLAITLFIALIVNCAKKEEVKTFEQYEENGVKITKNNGIPADSTLELNFNKVFTISTQEDSSLIMKNPGSINEDKDQNFYVLDSRTHDVKKFNKLGQYQKTISREGEGPGELKSPVVMFIDNDTLTVFSISSSKISKFSLDGELYYDKAVDRISFNGSRMSPNGKNLVCYTLGMLPDELVEFNMSLVDLLQFKVKSNISSIQFTMADAMSGKFSPFDTVVPYCIGNENVYLSDGSDHQYKFFSHDFEGNKNGEIRKSYRQIRFSESEQAELKKNTRKKDFEAPTNKDAIQDIYTDKYGRVLVIPGIDRNKDTEGKYIDIFKNGIFLNRVDYSKDSGVFWEKSGELYFSGTRMYFVNSEDLSIDIYDY
ncbi:MAG: 6-bladed beta-propeller [Candidatus Delongbacteria bacterium]|jgi:hypothetical protein|nr:6-bladed beta-propeller [Candidatus Delongbacteria bacterium]